MTSIRSAFSTRTLITASLLGLTLLVAGTAAIIAQASKPASTPTPVTPAPTSPTLSDTLKLHFFRAQSEMQTAQSQAKEAVTLAESKQAAFQAAVGELSKACGTAAQPSMSKDGDLVCAAVAKPAAQTTSATPATKK